ncbi:MAG TPA: hypothetical protein VKC60_11990, partial [Opitutaceae bacterium]|nr:hypothetical protein [Opitutaceae bacterium]
MPRLYFAPKIRSLIALLVLAWWLPVSAHCGQATYDLFDWTVSQPAASDAKTQPTPDNDDDDQDGDWSIENGHIEFQKPPSLTFAISALGLLALDFPQRLLNLSPSIVEAAAPSSTFSAVDIWTSDWAFRPRTSLTGRAP